MARIFISYGIPKSASTFAWQLIKHVAITGGLPIATLTSKSKGANSPEDYIESISDRELALVREDIGDAPVVIKTHGDVTSAVARLVSDGNAQVFVSYRDLRDVALSLLDHGAKSREKGIKDFADLYDIRDTVEVIGIQVAKFEDWVQICDPLLIPYDQICFDTRKTISNIEKRLGVSVDVERIFDYFSTNKHLIGQFNKGERRRFERELKDKENKLFVKEFESYYAKYFPQELAQAAAAHSENSGLREDAGARSTLTELANRFKTDKGTKSGAPPHRYTYLYDLLFWLLKDKAINILEIGLAVGGPEIGGPADRKVMSPSVQMWLSYFTRAQVFGFDISDFSHMTDTRFTFIQGDAGSEADLRRVADSASVFDIIIDDGSHASYHQQLALKLLFPKLAPDGIYVIEDLQWQSPAFESVLPEVPKTATFLKRFFEDAEYVENNLLPIDHMMGLKGEIASFAAFGAFDGAVSPTKLIVIRKAALPRESHSNTPVAAPGTAALSIDDLITAAYAAILRREPDLGGLQTYQNTFKSAPPRVGLERTLNGLLKSKEGQRKILARIKSEQAHSNERRPKVLFVQTADPHKYARLLSISSQSTREFCRRHEFNYESHLGIIRGFHTWQATYNRIPILYRLTESGFAGWACYLDADAFVADLNFDLATYLSDKNDVALIAARGGQSFWWTVNAGVLLFNLNHPLGRAIVREWHNAFCTITDDELRLAEDWSAVPDDQSLLQQVLNTMPDAEQHIIIDRGEPL